MNYFYVEPLVYCLFDTPLFFCDDEKMIVTGSEGFIGKALCRELTKRGVEVIGVDRKSGTEATKVCELLKNGGIDCVFHLAAQTSVFNGNLNKSGRITLILSCE